jgi:hypothetical protein
MFMKAHLTTRFLSLLLLICCATAASAQVFADSAAAGTSGACGACQVINVAASADADLSTYSQLTVDDSLEGAVVYDQLFFSSPASAGEYVGFVIEPASPGTVDAQTLAHTHILPMNGNVASGDTIAPGDYVITPVSGSATKYTIEFVAPASFDCLQLNMTSGVPGTVTELRLYDGYYSGQNTLPISFKDFSAVRESNQVTLSWKTASETNNKYFTVQRSLDGQNYEPVAFLDGAGNSTVERQYAYRDESAPSALCYYRIRQTDNNGTNHYFPAVTIEAMYLEDGFAIYPNPSTGGDLRIQLLHEGGANVSIYSASGRQVYSADVPSGSGLTQLEISSQLAKGIYVVRLNSEAGILTRRLLVN